MFKTNRYVELGADSTGKSRFITKGAYVAASNKADTKASAVSISNRVSEKENSKVNTEHEADGVETAAATAISGSASIAEFVVEQIQLDVLEQFVNTDTDTFSFGVNPRLNRIYSDMYYHDSICGEITELFSTIPWSEFTLTGLSDNKQLEPFIHSVEALNPVNLLPSISIEHQVLGAFLGTTAFDESEGVYTSIFIHSMDDAQLMPLPIQGADPLINVVIPQEYIRALNLNDPRITDEIKKRIAPAVLEAARNGNISKVRSSTGGRGNNGATGVPLNPEDTIFIPRRGLSKDYAGVSAYKRAVPAWLMEKALIRGTLDQVYKRQRAALHISVGDGAEWIPTLDELQQISSDFQQIDLDPVSAMIVTRTGISVEEVRRGDDFWKWTDSYDQLTQIKLHALGTSEAFLSGDVSYQTMERSLSVTLEQIKNFRNVITNELFYNRMFPRLAVFHNVYASRSGREHAAVNELDHYDGIITPYYAELASSTSVKDYSPNRHVFPRVHWMKQLLPEGDAEYMGMLDSLTEKGYTIPVRMIMSAAGIKLDSILNAKESDLEDRKRLKEYFDEVAKLSPKPAAEGEEDSGDGFEGASARASKLLPLLKKGQGNFLHRVKRKSAHPIEVEIFDRDHRGKINNNTSKRTRKQKTEQFNKTVASAAAENARRENYTMKQQQEAMRKRSYSYKRPKNENSK